MYLLILLLVGLLIGGAAADAGGGVPCCACTLVLTLVEQVADLQATPIDQFIEKVCTWFPPPLNTPCEEFFGAFGTVIIQDFLAGMHADDICFDISICTNSTCRLNAPTLAEKIIKARVPPSVFAGFVRKFAQRLPAEQRRVSDNPLWDWLMKEINIIAQYHEPLQDFDSDLYSELTPELRGYYWRGRDCDDGSASVHPGVAPDYAHDSPDVDWNCNGIYGVNQAGVSYEELLCGGTYMPGVAVLGDSAAAHFHLPPMWLTAADINDTTYSDAVSVLMTEVDWPMLSWATGHLSTADFPQCPGPMNSVYEFFYQQNQCIFRDYQNIGVNGAASGAMASSIDLSLARTPADQPLMVFYALIGNDVCHPEHDLSRMTEPDVFAQNVRTSLQYLDAKLPNGSHVYLVGLVDGRILWDTMNNLTHPIGVTYADVYDYLNCLQINPCWAYLNRNDTVRELAWQRSDELNSVLEGIVANDTYANFDMLYHGIPLDDAIAYVKSKGLPVSDLIEPVDGFHESQLGSALFAQFFFLDIQQRAPQWIPEVNPNNQEITALFGNQGGY